MASQILPDMVAATRLVGAGKLGEATALIQRLLRGATPSPPAPAADSPIIEGTAVTVDSTARQALPAPAAAQPAPSPGHAGRRPPRPRTGLAETLRGLAGRVMPAGFDHGVGGLARPAPEPLAAGASFETASFANAAGTRDYKLYRPGRSGDQKRPLIVMLHGCTQSPDDFAAGTRMNALAEAQGCFVAYPAQSATVNLQKCWNWFNPDDQRRDQGEPSLIAGITRQIIHDHPIDPSRVYIAGLSAGGAAAAIMGATYPELYAAVGVHSGLPAGAASDLPSALTAMRQGAAAGGGNSRRVPTIVFHGDQDATVHPRNGDAIVSQTTASLTGLHSTVRHGVVPDGHAFSRTVHADAAGRIWCEQWTIHGAGHAWAGGSRSGSYTDPRGPDATREMLRFFFESPPRRA
ncbi:MAG: PHB depolymerase family esterase [Azospirillaceae bacterium]|nr:PHB depolymerase family esterase [Azospirillaceae bacterium]